MASTTAAAAAIRSRPSPKATVSVCRPTASAVSMSTRRQALTSLVAVVVVGATVSSAKARDIPLFGIRKKLQKVEEEVEKEAEKVVVAAEAELKTAEEDLQKAVEDGGTSADALQAGAVVGAELLGVVAATSIVNGILSPDSA